MSIDWMKTAGVYPEGGYGPNDFMALDPKGEVPALPHGDG
jgi:hypothetical protein